MLSEETYNAQRAQAMEEMTQRVQRVKDSKDPLVLYRDVTPLLDLKHMMQRSGEVFADRPAFWVKEGSDAPYKPRTYRETCDDFNGLGTALVAGGLAGKRIAVIGENSYPWSIAYLAIVCGTGICVPIDKELSIREVKQFILSAECSAVIFSDKFEKAFVELRDSGELKLEALISMSRKESKDGIFALTELIAAGKDQIAEGNRAFLDARIMRDEMAVILFTSGTAGLSKGVMLSHANLIFDIMFSPTLLLVKKEDIFFSVLPLHHTYECTCGFLIPLYRGASVAHCEGLKHIVKNLAEAKPTVFLGVPALFENMYNKIWQNIRKKGKENTVKKVIALNRKTKKIGLDLAPRLLKDIHAVFGGRMRILISGGAAINPAIVQGVRDFGINMVQGYGLTETAPICALNPDRVPKNESAGRALPETCARIADPDPETGIGEICLSGPNVMLGYYNNPEATAEVIQDGWFHSGDLGRIDAEGYIHITGRKKNVIITKNGKNVYPEELEYHLSNIPCVAESMVWGKDGGDGQDTVITASIYPHGENATEALGASYTEADLEKLLWAEIDKINEQMPFYKRIRKLSIRKEPFEKNTSNKIKRYVASNKE